MSSEQNGNVQTASLILLATATLVFFKILATSGEAWTTWAIYPWWFALFGPVFITVCAAAVAFSIAGILFGLGWLAMLPFERHAKKQNKEILAARLADRRKKNLSNPFG